jgi:predicted ArsR family transcriptional regulator
VELLERRPATAAEARALASPLRIRILRLCLDRALTNKELADRLGRDPGTILHHVRTLVATGFLAPEADRRGARGATERPYRATGKSWTLDIGESTTGMLAVVDAFRAELAEVPAGDVMTLSRLGVRLADDQLAAFLDRLKEIVDEMHAADDDAGDPYGVFIALHRRHEDGTPGPRGGSRKAGPSASRRR